MDPLSRAFNFISDVKNVPHVDRHGRHPDHHPVVAFLRAPENVAGMASAALITTPLYYVFKQLPPSPMATFFLFLPAGLLAFAMVNPLTVMRGLGMLPPEVPQTIYKQPGNSSLQARMEAGIDNRHYLRHVTPFRALLLTGAAAIFITTTDSLKQAGLVAFAMGMLMVPAFLNCTIRETRQYLRNRMIIKGHWQTVQGRKPPRIGPDKPEGSSFGAFRPA